MKIRTTSLLFAVLLLSNVTALGDDGITQEEPATGPYVKVSSCYMVPYKTKIPGTDVEFEMVPIPGGTFLLGSPPGEADRKDDEGPQVEVIVEPFWMGKHEITWAEYSRFMGLYEVFKIFQREKIRVVDDANRSLAITAPPALYDPSFTYELGQDPAQPAATMTQYAAKQYTKWLSGITGHQYRLPLEAEWEYACRAGTKTAYYFGDTADDLADHGWFFDNADETTHPVGELKPNPWGLYDMYGNVAELVLDEYQESGYAHLKEKKLKALDTYVTPVKQYPRVCRGGHWDSDPEDCRSASRMASDDEAWKIQDPNIPKSPWWYTDYPSQAVGFRLLRPLNELPAAAMEKFWEADVPQTKQAVADRLSEGRGVLGTVNKDLPGAIEALKK